MGTTWATPDPGLSSPIELAGGEVGGGLDLPVIGEALSCKGIPPEQPPPALDKVEPAGAGRHGFLMHAGMLTQPLTDWPAGVTGEVVVDQVEVALGIGGVDGVEELLEAGRIAGGSGEGEDLPITRTQGAIHPDLIRSTPIVEGSLDAMAIG